MLTVVTFFLCYYIFLFIKYLFIIYILISIDCKYAKFIHFIFLEFFFLKGILLYFLSREKVILKLPYLIVIGLMSIGACDVTLTIKENGSSLKWEFEFRLALLVFLSHSATVNNYECPHFVLFSIDRHLDKISDDWYAMMVDIREWINVDLGKTVSHE